jgi:hypothetical protein
MQAQLLSAGQNSLGKGELHHGFAAGYCETAVKRAQRRREPGEAINDLLGRDVGSVFQMPSVGIMTIGTTQ